jgi:hypothetical protein
MSSAAEREEYLTGLAVQSLATFDGTFSDLERVVSDVDSILRSLAEVSDPRFIRLIFRQWGQLEILFAIALDEASRDLTEQEAADAREIVLQLVAHLRSRP